MATKANALRIGNSQSRRPSEGLSKKSNTTALRGSGVSFPVSIGDKTEHEEDEEEEDDDFKGNIDYEKMCLDQLGDGA